MDPFDQAVRILEDAEAPVLLCHVHPDGDALGSMLGMHLLCASQGRTPMSSWGSPFRTAPHYRFLPGLEQAVPAAELPTAPDVVVTFDVGALHRLGDVSPVAEAARHVIVLDHHKDNTRFGTINVVRTDVAATAVLVHDLAAALGWPLFRDAAVDLYVGLLTDTGRFQYPNTTPEVFLLAEELAEYDLPITALNRELYEKHRFRYVQLAGLALARARLDEQRSCVAAWITEDDLARHGVEFDETEGFIDLLRRTAEAEVAVALKEAPGEGLRVSLRSLGAVDVGEVAAALGGGGHAFMAGFQSDRSIDETLHSVLAALPVTAGG